MRLKKELITKLKKNPAADVSNNDSRIVRYVYHAEGHLSVALKQDPTPDEISEIDTAEYDN